jgi:AraC-like DNA-binding protein
MDATSAEYRAGYYDASHFRRDYKRHCGVPPARDAERLRGTFVPTSRGISLMAAEAADLVESCRGWK